jgi:hypothetical protein
MIVKLEACYATRQLGEKACNLCAYLMPVLATMMEVDSSGLPLVKRDFRDGQQALHLPSTVCQSSEQRARRNPMLRPVLTSSPLQSEWSNHIHFANALLAA